MCSWHVIRVRAFLIHSRNNKHVFLFACCSAFQLFRTELQNRDIMHKWSLRARDQQERVYEVCARLPGVWSSVGAWVSRAKHPWITMANKRPAIPLHIANWPNTSERVERPHMIRLRSTVIGSLHSIASLPLTAFSRAKLPQQSFYYRFFYFLFLHCEKLQFCEYALVTETKRISGLNQSMLARWCTVNICACSTRTMRK